MKATLVAVTCFLITQQLAVEGAPTYWYANAMNLASDDEIHLGCLSAGGCGSIVYLPPSCNGCFDSECGAVKRANLVQGGTDSIGSTIIAGTGALGSMICSTGQLVVKSGQGTIFHEWLPGTLSGKKFAYTTYRGSGSTCGIFSQHTALVDVTSSSGTNQVTVSNFSVTTVSGLNAQNSAVTFSSNEDILVSCAKGTDDFSNLVPLTSNEIYHWESANSRLLSVDCTTMVATAEVPSCTRLDSGTITLTPNTDTQVYNVDGNQVNLYAGVPHRCSASTATCLSMFTTADSNGLETTTAMPVSHFANYFVVLRDSVRLALTSNAAATCTIDISGSSTPVTLSGSVPLGFFSHYKNDATFVAGTTISCDAPVMAILDNSASQKEYNVYGHESSTLWAPYLVFGTLAPTVSPTPLPTASPSLQPSEAPSTSPTLAPSASPSTTPTNAPSSSPSTSPTDAPSTSPTRSPSASPNVAPTGSPVTPAPSLSPTPNVTEEPVKDEGLDPGVIAGIAAGATLGGAALVLGGLLGAGALGAAGGLAGGAAGAAAGGGQGGVPPIGGYESFASGDGSAFLQELSVQGVLEGAIEQVEPDDFLKEPELREVGEDSDGENSEFEVNMEDLL